MKRSARQAAPQPPEIRKQREIRFSRFPPGQVPEAAGLLRGLGGLEVDDRSPRHAVGVDYNLREYTLRGIEAGLVDQGFHLDNTLLTKLHRALIHYVEETQLHNLGVPVRDTKQHLRDEAYLHAWEHHPHGDRDDTPPEWREYK